MGAALSLYHQNFPPKAKWSTSQIPSLSGQVFVVTGGAGGIGLETTRALLEKDATVYILSRNSTKSSLAIQKLKTETGKEAQFVEIDLGDLDSIRKAAAVLKTKETSIHALINNAGIMMPPIARITAQGYDAQFGINLLGHYYLTTLLLPLLQAKATPAEPARIVNVSSGGHILCPGIDWDTVKEGEKRKKKPLLDLYNQSKFANVVLASELAKRYGPLNITSTSLHPGLIVTELGRDMVQPVVKLIHYFSYSAAQGALTTLYAATAPENAHANGKYFSAWAKEETPNPKTLDPAVGEKLWTWCEEQIREFEKGGSGGSGTA